MTVKAPNAIPTTIAVREESLDSALVGTLLAAHVPDETVVPISQQARSV